tara:strand:- start:1813 stop:2664 length:852 start_codon:yes stop_codon:yes gene_type:complete
VSKICFIADIYRNQLLGGAESNDDNLIKSLSSVHEVDCYQSSLVTTEQIDAADVVLVANFTTMSIETRNYITANSKYIIYEHDHKYVNTRDPSRFQNFKIPETHLINKAFYENARQVVVLSNICKEVMESNIPNSKVHSIGCSLWALETFEIIEQLSKNEKLYDHGIMFSQNPTKNYLKTKEFCQSNNLEPVEIQSSVYTEFLLKMSECKNFIFLPAVLETYSRICAEAKMMNCTVTTNAKLIGFFSEDFSGLSGQELIDTLRKKNSEAYTWFIKTIEDIASE